MRSPLASLGTVLISLLGALVPATPPAEATSVRGVVFVGSMALGVPIGDPCTGFKTTPGTAKCPPTTPTVHSDLPLPGWPLPNTNVHVHWGGNTVPITSFQVDACIDVGGNVNKASKAPAHAGTCTFAELPSFKNHLNGYCALNGGQVVVISTDALGQAWTLDIHFTGVGPKLLLTGHARKVSTGRTGKLVGVVEAFPNFELLPFPTTPHVFNNSCPNKSARRFTMAGRAGWSVPTG